MERAGKLFSMIRIFFEYVALAENLFSRNTRQFLRRTLGGRSDNKRKHS